MITAFLVGAVLLVGATQDRPPPAPVTPFPTDEELAAAFASAHPEAEVLTIAPSPMPATNARIQLRRICGVARVGDRIEPFSVVATWSDPAVGDVVRLVGAPARPPEVAQWKTRTSFPTFVDYSGDGEIDRSDRNIAVMARRTALMWCQDLRPPEGVTWIIEPEPHPDPARQRRNEALARRMTDLLMGSVKD